VSGSASAGLFLEVGYAKAGGVFDDVAGRTFFD
jgi:hypothetical protein